MTADEIVPLVEELVSLSSLSLLQPDLGVADDIF
jgi:hypothetical protein